MIATALVGDVALPPTPLDAASQLERRPAGTAPEARGATPLSSS